MVRKLLSNQGSHDVCFSRQKMNFCAFVFVVFAVFVVFVVFVVVVVLKNV